MHAVVLCSHAASIIFVCMLCFDGTKLIAHSVTERKPRQDRRYRGARSLRPLLLRSPALTLPVCVSPLSPNNVSSPLPPAHSPVMCARALTQHLLGNDAIVPDFLRCLPKLSERQRLKCYQH